MATYSYLSQYIWNLHCDAGVDEQYIMLCIAYIFIKLAEWMMLKLFLSRLHYTFDHTSLECSKKLLYTLYTLLTLIIINIISIILFIFIGIFFKKPWAWPLAYFSAAIWIISYLILCITLVTLFIRRMDKVIVTKYNGMMKSTSHFFGIYF